MMEDHQGLYSFEVDYAFLDDSPVPDPAPEAIRYVIVPGCDLDCAAHAALRVLLRKPPRVHAPLGMAVSLVSAPGPQAVS